MLQDATIWPAPRLAGTATALPPPPIPACRAWAAGYGGARGPLLDLTQSVPGVAPPQDLLQRLAAAAADPATAGYGPLEGEAPLRAALAAEMRGIYGGDIAADDLRITAGANIGFTLAMSVLTAPGDAVLIPAPWFFNHRMALALRGVEAVPLPCRAEDGFLPDPERAAALLGPRVRAILLVTPNNPTGAAIPAALLGRFAELCRARGLWLVLDETYRDFLPDPLPAGGRAEAGSRAPGALPAPHRLLRRPDWRDFVVQLYSFSKAYGLPGHRMGALAAGPAMLAEFVKAVDNIQICAPRPPQLALAWAIPALRAWRAENRARMAARGRAFRQALARAPAWRLEAAGAMFAWLRVPEDGPDSAMVAERLARERGLVTLPGGAFGPGGQRHLRLAFATVEAEAMPDIVARLG
ncbi:aminotransferase [Paracraurococcus ruber]|uniref:Aminotransferase n=1 Tax=Paracraurococcus ruber TaxID=77675 RepID=A0ABS1CT29_9PROT|nr:aminotransferase [Paracraurococcus ruber]MBK1657412.1 aspartate/tyrosine/aromatic aminotransferase [Paracraurococcus ruber]TDG33842.1 aminotransferase [Paracraurococcus ruber]